MLGANYDIIGKPIGLSDNAVRIERPSVYTVGLGEKREITTRRPSVASKSAAISVATTYNTPAPPGLVQLLQLITYYVHSLPFTDGPTVHSA